MTDPRDDIPPHGLRLFLEGAVAALLGCAGALFLFPDQTGLVSIFLCAVASLGSVERQLAWNTREIIDRGRTPWRVNAVFTGRLLALFSGQLLAFSAVALVMDVELLHAAFAHQIGPFAGKSFPTMTFPGALAVWGHNLGVLCLFFVMALLYRHGGALLAVAWNASVWGVVFGSLARTWSGDGGPPLLEAYLRVMLGVSPHMAAEAVGYVLAAFAGVFLSKALAHRRSGAAYWDSLLQTLTLMLAIAILSVTAGALWEAFLAPIAVRWLSG